MVELEPGDILCTSYGVDSQIKISFRIRCPLSPAGVLDDVIRAEAVVIEADKLYLVCPL